MVAREIAVESQRPRSFGVLRCGRSGAGAGRFAAGARYAAVRGKLPARPAPPPCAPPRGLLVPLALLPPHVRYNYRVNLNVF